MQERLNMVFTFSAALNAATDQKRHRRRAPSASSAFSHSYITSRPIRPHRSGYLLDTSENGLAVPEPVTTGQTMSGKWTQWLPEAVASQAFPGDSKRVRTFLQALKEEWTSNKDCLTPADRSQATLKWVSLSHRHATALGERDASST